MFVDVKVCGSYNYIIYTVILNVLSNKTVGFNKLSLYELQVMSCNLFIAKIIITQTWPRPYYTV